MKASKVHDIGRLPEGALHGSPVGLVQLSLELGLQPHQDEVANQVRLAELQTGGVHALEDQLRVVLRAVQ